MSGSIEWNLKISLNLTHSLGQFVGLNYTHESYPYVDESLNDLDKAFRQHLNIQESLFRNLEQVLNRNGWIISSLDENLKSLRENGRFLTAEGEILIIKGYSETDISAIVKDGPYNYFLVAALSCNGKILYNWKNKDWYKASNYYRENPYEIYYFYYCKVTPKSLTKFLRFEEVAKEYADLYKTLGNIWNFTKNNLNILESNWLSIRNNHEEEKKNETIRENNEAILELVRENEQNKEKIADLESKIKRLEEENEKYKESTNLYKIKENELQNMEKRCSLLENNNQEFVEIAEDQEKQIKKLEILNESNKEAILQANQKIIALQAENSSLIINIREDSNRKILDLKAEKDRLEAENSYLKANKNDKSSESMQKINRVLDLQAKKDSLEEEIASLRMNNRENSSGTILQVNQRFIDSQFENEGLEAENISLKSSLSEKETQIQFLTNLNNEISENNKILQEKLKNIEQMKESNYLSSNYSQENEIIKLPPNTKHGLPNFGNTCYLNSLLQIFASTPLFISKFERTSSQFCKSLSSLLSSMRTENSPKTISNLTQDFYKNLIKTYTNIEQYSQQDVKEVFNMILSKSEEDVGNIDIFSIVFHQIFTCRNHFYQHHKSEYSDIQSFLIIPPQSKDSPENFLQNHIFCPPTKQSLFCNRCNEVVETDIRLEKIDWPAYLILYFPSPPSRIKESIFINIENRYEMYGAICYYQDEGSFHYTAFTKDGNEWNEYNDENVGTKPIDPSVINLLFYSKKTSPF